MELEEMTSDKIIEVLERIALLLELKGENPFKVRAYRNGAEIISSFEGDFIQRARDGELAGIKGIGDALQQKIHELASTGRLGYYENLRAEFPATIFDLFEIPGLGGKKIKILHGDLGIGSVDDLKKACEAGEVAALSGFGTKSEKKILEAIAFRESTADHFRLGDVAGAVEMILDDLRAHPAVSRAEAAGSFRRGKEVVHDLDFIVATKAPQEVMDHFVSRPWVAGVIAHGSTKSSIRMVESGLPCDLRAVSNSEYPFALLYFTGSKDHNVELRSRARKRGMTLNEYRLAPMEDKTPDPAFPFDRIHEESDVYRALALPDIPAPLRENRGEFEAAEAGEVPRLVEIANLRGAFHNHTTASDGKSSLTEMAEAARELGLQYLGIADHSKSSFQANGLNETRLLKQVEEIRELNRSWDDFRLFAGVECDILKDGSLDFDDGVLAQLDYTVASVHSVFNLPKRDMTRRIVKAIENPHVTMLGHPTGRLLLRREAYELDIPQLIDAAAETGTIIELNANPYRLDLDWRWWRMAREKGVKCAINPDAHHTSQLQFLFFGVKVAQKGWLTREDVINCLPLEEVGKELEKKRGS